jgi:transposase-like protein
MEPKKPDAPPTQILDKYAYKGQKMDRISNFFGLTGPPVQHSPSQESGTPRLVIRTLDQARHHWRALTSPSQVADAMAELDEQAEGGHVDEETYRLLANALRDAHNSLQSTAARQASVANLPARPPVPNWQPSARASAQTMERAETAMRQGASVEQVAQQFGIRDILDMINLRTTFGSLQNPRASVQTMERAKTAIRQGASVEQVAQQFGIRDLRDMMNLRTTFNELQNPRVSVQTMERAEAAIRQGASVEQAAQQHGVRNVMDINRLDYTFREQQRTSVQTRRLG